MGKEYSSQLFIPKEMVLANDLIKVWNIDDERQVESESMDIAIKEEATYDKASVVAPVTSLKENKVNASTITTKNLTTKSLSFSYSLINGGISRASEPIVINAYEERNDTANKTANHRPNRR